MTHPKEPSYRSMDESGSPESCGAVAERWIGERAAEAVTIYGDAECLEINRHRIEGGGSVIALYAHRQPVAVATIFRDPMNFSQLIRWTA